MSAPILIYMLFVIAVTFGVALRWRPATAAIVLAGLVLAGCVAPFMFFGVWALIAGEPMRETLSHVAVLFPALLDLAAYTVVWAAGGLVLGAVFRSGWKRMKGAAA